LFRNQIIGQATGGINAKQGQMRQEKRVQGKKPRFPSLGQQTNRNPSDSNAPRIQGFKTQISNIFG
jgi:hypothetical protein